MITDVHAHVTVDGIDRGLGPVNLPDLPLGDHVVLAHLDGRPDFTKTIRLEKAGQSVDAMLSLPAPPAPTPAPGTDASKSDPTAAARPDHRKGKLTLDTVPWTKVLEGGKELGDTPLVEVKLSEGTQTARSFQPPS